MKPQRTRYYHINGIDPTEVDYEEMVDLAKMDTEEQDNIRCRLGYKKIVDACRQAKRDGYKWVWIDTCCIDKRSSAELSEAINSMYRWYANAKVCYAYLHDVDGSSFPNKSDYEKYHESNGWPEWFSRGWTLQEMIAPRNLQFFNRDWQPIGDKKSLAGSLKMITGVPKHILADGLEGNRPCVAEIISWATYRMTTRVEDRAYSLMGLLDVNMPMLYGEGKKAFHRLQLEVIRSSNDQSIFAWGCYSNDPSDFGDWFHMELRLMDRGQFIKEFSPTDVDNFDVFSITNRGIQIWMPLRRYRDSNFVFRAYLPCRDAEGDLVSIDLVLWNSNENSSAVSRRPRTLFTVTRIITVNRQFFLFVPYQAISRHSVICLFYPVPWTPTFNPLRKTHTQLSPFSCQILFTMKLPWNFGDNRYLLLNNVGQLCRRSFHRLA